MTKYVCITKAAHLLNICRQRVQQLLYERRIEGAFKKGRFWQIPLFDDMPKIVPGTRGPEGTWRKQFQKTKTYIHVNQHRIRDNQTKKDEDKEPVICVRRGDRVEYCDKVDILGGLCKVVYDPDHCKPCGARVWIEIDPIVAQIIAMANPLVTHSFKLHLTENKSSNFSKTGNKSG